MYSGEYDAWDVTLSVYPHRASLKNMPDHGGNRTYDLWNTNTEKIKFFTVMRLRAYIPGDIFLHIVSVLLFRHRFSSAVTPNVLHSKTCFISLF
jgi:hypothetical protein